MRFEGTEVPQEHKALSVRGSPLGFCTHSLGSGKEIVPYACISIMRIDLLCPFATLCLSRGKKPTHAFRPQLETHPAQAFSFSKTLRSLRGSNALIKHLPLTRSKYSPSLYVHPRTSSICPPHTQTSWVFSPFTSISS